MLRPARACWPAPATGIARHRQPGGSFRAWRVRSSTCLPAHPGRGMSECCQVSVTWISMQAMAAALRWTPILVGTTTTRQPCGHSDTGVSRNAAVRADRPQPGIMTGARPGTVARPGIRR